MNTKIILRLFFIVSLIITASGCGTSPSTTSSTTFTTVYTGTLKPVCASCHAPGMQGTTDGITLDFSTQTLAFNSLTNSGAYTAKDTAQSNSSCHTATLVVPSNPTKSYLLATLDQTYNTGFAAAAAISGCTPMSITIHNNTATAAEISEIANWIQNGALNN